MRNSSFFEKLTGSLRLSDEDLSALSENDDQKNKVSKSNKKNLKKDSEYEEVIEEIDEDNFDIPEDAEIETIEEVIEDDSIDHEEIEEYYEEIIEEDTEDEESPKISIYGENDEYEDDVVAQNTKDLEDEEEVFEEMEEKTEEENEKVLNVNSSKSIELPIDVFEMHNEVVLRILVPGITPENLKVSITKDRVSLSCIRPAPDGIKDSSYFEREIPYGDFTRMINLPSDVDVEKAEAVEKYGLLIIRLPKLDAKKVQELKIKSV